MRRTFHFFVLLTGLAAGVELAAQGRPAPCPRPLGLLRPQAAAEASSAKNQPNSIPVKHEPDGDVIKVDTNLVVTEFDVRDKKGRPAHGLNQMDFKVEEDGVEQKIEIFSFGKASAFISRSIVLIIDYSQSQAPYIENSIEAAKVLVDLLEGHDRMAIVTDDVELIIGFTSNKSELKEKLDLLKHRSREGRFGKSLQMSALSASVIELFDLGDKRPIVIFQTDGDEYAQLALLRGGWRRGDCEGMLKNFADLEKTLEAAGTTVYSVIPGILPLEQSGDDEFGSGPADLEQTVKREARLKLASFDGPMKELAVRNWAKGRLRDAGAIERLSARTGGMSQFLDRPENAGRVYRRILDEMNNRYLVGYYPVKSESDGRARSIRISLRNASGLKVNGRSSYTPSK